MPGAGTCHPLPPADAWVQVLGSQAVRVAPPSSSALAAGSDPHLFSFDHVAGEGADQEAIFRGGCCQGPRHGFACCACGRGRQAATRWGGTRVCCSVPVLVAGLQCAPAFKPCPPRHPPQRLPVWLAGCLPVRQQHLARTAQAYPSRSGTCPAIPAPYALQPSTCPCPSAQRRAGSLLTTAWLATTAASLPVRLGC